MGQGKGRQEDEEEGLGDRETGTTRMTRKMLAS